MEAAIALLTLSAMEIVLGIDNLIFIAILTSRLPKEQQSLARKLGLGAALVTRLLLLLSISYVMKLDQPLFHLSPALETVGLPTSWLTDPPEHAHPSKADSEADGEERVASSGPDGISIKDLILIGGGLFLVAKSVWEIHHKMEGPVHSETKVVPSSFTTVLIQVALFDVLFSLDSVITAVGMARDIWVMVVAVCIAMTVMLIFANPVSNFVEKHPTITVLALSFLILIGVLLMAEGFGQHLNKGYIYFAMAFSLIVEMVNMRVRSHANKKASQATA